MNLILEIIKIFVPVIATVVLGLWISQSNEKLKGDIAKKLSLHDIWLSKYISIIDELLALVRRIAANLESIYNTMDDVVYYRGDRDRQHEEIEPFISKIYSANRDLNELISSNNIYLPDEILTILSSLREKFASASSLFTPHWDEETDFGWIPVDSSDNMEKAKRLIFSEISSLKKDLEDQIKKSIQSK